MRFDPRGKRSLWKDISTDCVHAGEERVKPYDSITTPIIQSSTFVFKNSEDIHRYTKEKRFRFEYGRYGNPTQLAAEKKLSEVRLALVMPSRRGR